MAECEHLARTSAYFDGALSAADEAHAAEHLATCAACQSLLGDAVGLDAALSTASPRARAKRTSRWPWIAGGVAAAAAAAIALVVVWPRGGKEPDPQVAIALPQERALEARFSGPRFAPHRPHAAVRSQTQPTEAISLSALAELEKAGDAHDLIAALAATGDLARADALAAKLPDDAASASDRAALALAHGDAEAALGHAQHALGLDASSAAALWNLGLAARQLHLDRVSKRAFDALAAKDAPGWTVEARDHAAAAAREIAVEDGFPAFETAAKAMVAGGPPITAADVARYPAQSRQSFYDAARVAGDRARLDALKPLAAALDQASGTTTATAALDRIDPAIGAKFGERYRAVIARTATPKEMTALIGELARAGRGADDMRLGAIILSGQSGARIAELRTIAAPWKDAWFDLFIGREAVRAKYAPGDPRMAPPLREALAACPGGAVSYRCGELAYDLVEIETALGQDKAAEQAARTAVAMHRAGMKPLNLGRARVALAEMHRSQGRTALARAELEEIVMANGDRDCDSNRYARVTEAELAIVDGDWASARAALPAAAAPAGCTGAADIIGIAAAIDLARSSKDARDVATAEQWLATAGDMSDKGVAVTGALRLGKGDAGAVRAWVAAHAAANDADNISGVRAWAVTTLIDDAAARGDWADVLTTANAPAAECAVVLSSDDDRISTAVKTPAGLAGEHRLVPVRAQDTTPLLSPALAQRLAGCKDIAVVALPPLHGRSDLLPTELPWWFAGDAPPRPSPVKGTRAVEVSDARPPDPSLPTVGLQAPQQPFDVRLTGTAATPSRVLAALKDATYAELDVHGVASASRPDAAYLALSPEPDGSYALHADAVVKTKLAAAPVIVLAACRAAAVAPYLRERWSLPDAFVAAGASAVIAADAVIPDKEARAVLDELHRRIAAGESPAAAVAAVRAASKPQAWERHLMLFR